MNIRVPLFIFFIQITQTLIDETLIAFASSEIVRSFSIWLQQTQFQIFKTRLSIKYWHSLKIIIIY